MKNQNFYFFKNSFFLQHFNNFQFLIFCFFKHYFFENWKLVCLAFQDSILRSKYFSKNIFEKMIFEKSKISKLKIVEILKKNINFWKNKSFDFSKIIFRKLFWSENRILKSKTKKFSALTFRKINIFYKSKSIWSPMTVAFISATVHQKRTSTRKVILIFR